MKIDLEQYRLYLQEQEKSPVTIQKYIRDARKFLAFHEGGEITKERTVAYKAELIKRGYAIRSINSMIASVNSLMAYLGLDHCKIRSLRYQKATYCDANQELSKTEYEKLLKAAEGCPRMQLVMQTICATGIRVSELQYFTVEGIRRGEITVQCKSKLRTILIPGKLRKALLNYARKRNIKAGTLFVTRHGNPIDRSNIWAKMKALCKKAGINPDKVYPHNLRKLFARTFYRIEKDIAKLADILGHSSINTTRIYIMTTGTEHRAKIERLGLV